MFLALLFLSFLPCITLHVSRDINLSKTIQRTAMRAPTRMQEPADPAPYNAPCQQEAAKETDALPQFPILSPFPHNY
jgi:hypothetical protein